MSWNSSTMIERKRSCSASRTRRRRDEQVAGEQLEILEVERRLALLAGLVLGREEVEQLLQELLVAGRDELAARPARRSCAPPRSSRRARRRSASCARSISVLGQRREVERGLGRGDVVLGRARVVEQACAARAQVARRPSRIGRLVRARASASRPAERSVS